MAIHKGEPMKIIIQADDRKNPIEIDSEAVPSRGDHLMLPAENSLDFPIGHKVKFCIWRIHENTNQSKVMLPEIYVCNIN